MTGSASVPNTIATGGTRQPAANLDANFSALVDYLNDPTNRANYAADGGVANAYSVTLTPAPTALTDGLVVAFKAKSANTGACTLNVNGLQNGTPTANVPLVRADGTDIPGGLLVAGGVYLAVYDASGNGKFQLPGTIPTLGSIGAAPLAGSSSQTFQVGPATGTPDALQYTQSLTSAAWFDVTSSRTIGATYTNSTSHPRLVMATIYASTNGLFNIKIGGTAYAEPWASSVENLYTFVVPPNTSYSIGSGAGTPAILQWSEMQ